VFEFNKISTVATILSSFEAAEEKEEENYCKLLFVEWALLCDAYKKSKNILEKCRETERERERERESTNDTRARSEYNKNIAMIFCRLLKYLSK